MKKCFIVALILLLVTTMTACSGNKTVTDRQEIKQMTEEFYKDLLTADPITMSSYSNGELMTVVTKDQDKLHVHNEYDGSDVYSFILDGKRYTIATDGTLFEEESTYDFYADSIQMMLQMNITSYLDVEDDAITYSATRKDDNELKLTVKGKESDNEVTVYSKGTKENGKVSVIECEIKAGESDYKSEYRFAYDQYVEIPEYTVPKSYDNLPHVESPYKTYGEIIDTLKEDEMLFYTIMDHQLIAIDEKDGRYYQFSSVLDQDTVDAFNALDFSAEDYDAQAYGLIRDVEIEDCIDFTDELPSAEELSLYEGKTIKDLLDEGYEVMGYSFWEEHAYVFVEKDMMDYKVSVEPTEGFNSDGEFDYDAFDDFTIKEIVFDNPEYSALPMK